MMELRSAISSIIMASVPDRWVWTLDGSRSFTVGSAKKLLISGSDSTRWCKVVPLKVNILVWRISLDKLPTRMNLDVCGFDVPSILCPICGEVAENSNHLFFQCSFVSQVYELFGRWWDIQIPRLTSFQQWRDWVINLRLKRMQKSILEASFFFALVACVDS
nr:RNA-directed DNA polymerase, eukaryota [Tanacetum cinerariifolium]